MHVNIKITPCQELVQTTFVLPLLRVKLHWHVTVSLVDVLVLTLV